SGREIQELALGIDKKEMRKLFRVTLDGPGFINGQFIDEYLDEILPAKNIQDLRVEFGCCACNILDGREITFTKGSLGDAIRASISIPGILTPHKLGDYTLVDGGLANPVPVSLCRKLGADFVIAVNVLNTPCLKNKVYDFPDKIRELKEKKDDKKAENLNQKLKLFIAKEIESFELTAKRIGAILNLNDELSIVNIISQTYLIAESNLAKFTLLKDKPELLVEPNMRPVRHFDFDKVAESVLIGEKEMWKVAAQNKDLSALK
ncbi:MAG: patatin-like phospholipase family protein, partial [bacterium]|nr:patatin-like phospholipase family protein [bacterium]